MIKFCIWVAICFGVFIATYNVYHISRMRFTSMASLGNFGGVNEDVFRLDVNNGSLPRNPSEIEELQTVETEVAVTQKPCPTTPIVAGHDNDNRLGNKLWEYASVWSLSKMLGRPGYVPQSILTTLEKLFPHLSLSPLEDISHCGIDLGRRCNRPDILPVQTIAKRFKNRTLNLSASTRIPESLLLYQNKFASVFRFRQDLIEQVRQTISEVGGEGKVLVGVHVRRTDFAWLVPQWFKVSIVGKEYYLDAMNWFRSHVKGPLLFVILSDDVQWCWENLLEQKDVVIASKTTEHDLALLSLSNHTIIDYGTFGYWGGVMAGGHTISLDVDKPFNGAMSKNKNWHVFKRSKYP